MEIQRAIEIIQRKSSIPNDDETFDEIEKAYGMAVEAMKKQIAKLPISINMPYGSTKIFCPTCKAFVGCVKDGITEQMEYCNECGQHISRNSEV